VAAVVEQAWESLDMRPRLVSGDETPIPYAGSLEDAWLPSVDRIVGALRDIATE
jgi:pyruvate dehydrogenase E1 component beta subunit